MVPESDIGCADLLRDEDPPEVDDVVAVLDDRLGRRDVHPGQVEAARLQVEASRAELGGVLRIHLGHEPDGREAAGRHVQVHRVLEQAAHRRLGQVGHRLHVFHVVGLRAKTHTEGRPWISGRPKAHITVALTR